MVLDLVALSILAVFGLVGALRGGVASASSLLTLIASYAAAVWAAQNLGGPVAEKTDLSPIFAPLVAGSVAFLCAAVLVGGLAALIRRVAEGPRGDPPLGLGSRWAGAVLGVVRGALVVVLVSYLAIWLDAARQTGAFEGLEALPDLRMSSAAKATEKLVETTVSAAVDADDATAAVVARLAARPALAVRNLQEILADPRTEALQQDRFFWTLIENGAYERAMNRSSFRDLSRDREMRERFSRLGVVDAAAVEDAALFEERFREVLAEVGPRLKGLVDDPDLQRLAQDPEVLALLESGDTLGLVRHEGVQALVAKVSAR